MPAQAGIGTARHLLALKLMGRRDGEVAAMAEYPSALRVAHHVVYLHQDRARAFVAGRIAEAIQMRQDAQAAEWQKIGRFVERLLTAAQPLGAPPADVRQTRRRPRRYRRVPALH